MKKQIFVLLATLLLASCSCSASIEIDTSSKDSYLDTSVEPGTGWVVTFNTNGGSAVASVEVSKDTAVKRPTDPTKTGFYFSGWYSDEWCVTLYDFDLPVTSNMTLYAGWSETPVPTYDFDGPDYYEYTVSGMPTWVTNNDCVIFAWTWSNEDLGSWASLSYTSSTSATFKVNYELYGFLLARCTPGTTEPNWSITSGDGPGRVYNQTGDIDCTSGKYDYTCPSDNWMEYPKGD